MPAYPGDPGIVVALLMNLVTLRRGEGLFVPAGVLHAYLEGLGVELMAASDNVLRGGLTPKHIDVAELLAVLDPTPGPGAGRRARAGRRRARPLRRAGRGLRAVPRAARRASAPVVGAARRRRDRPGDRGRGLRWRAAAGPSVALRPGDAVLVTPDERRLRIEGDGRGLHRGARALTERFRLTVTTLRHAVGAS